MKLIDKETLVAEINSLDALYHTSKSLGGELFIEGLFCFIDTSEDKEVDLNEEIEKCLKKHSMLAVGKKDFTDIAKHFFELGLNTKQTSEEFKIGETEIYLEDDGGEPPYDGKQWLDLSCTEYEIPEDKFKDGDNVEIIIRKTQKGE